MKKSVHTLSLGGLRNSCATPLSAHNLRYVSLADGRKAWQPVGRPDVVVPGEWRPVALAAPSGFLFLVLASGAKLACIDLIKYRSADASVGDGKTDLIVIDTLGSDIKCASASGDFLTVMTAGSSERFLFDAGLCAWTRICQDEWPALSVAACDAGRCSAYVRSRRLSALANPLGTSKVAAPDRRSISADMREACVAVAAEAAAAGAFCGPVLMRYRLVGNDGEILFVSAPVLVGSTDIDDLTVSADLNYSDTTTIGAYSLSFPSWRPALTSGIPVTKSMAAMVSRIELLACPQFFPFDPSADPVIDISTYKSISFMLTVPGAEKSMSAFSPASAESLLRAALAAMPALERVVAVVQGPFAEGDVIDSKPSLSFAFGDVFSECLTLRRALMKKTEIADPVVGRVSQPHRFTASAVVSAAGMTLWGGLTALRFNGWKIENLTAARAGQGAWHAAVAVGFASGDETVVSVSQGTWGAPLTFGPVLSYPSPDAVSMTIIVSAAGRVRRKTVPLTPDPSGRCAVYVDRSFAPFALGGEDQAFVVPVVKPKPVPMPSFVAAAGDLTPLSVRSVVSLGDGQVQSLFPASRSQSSWNFSRPRFSALTSAGIFTLTVTPLYSCLMTPALVDTRRVLSPSDAVMLDSDVYAVADGLLLRVGVARTVPLVEGRRFESGFMAADTSTGELWLASGQSGASTVVCTRTGDIYSRDESLCSSSLASFAVVGGNLCDLSSQSPAASTFVRWDGLFDFGDSFVRVRSLVFDIRSPDVSYGNLVLRRLGFDDAEQTPSLQLALSGSIRSPVSVPVVALPMRRASLSFQARAAPGTLLSSASLTYCLIET